MTITIDKAVLELAIEALNHGITEMNHHGCAIECMPLHHATKAIREELAQPVQEPVLKVYKGDICYKSKADDQSYGMWCPVSYEYQHGLPDGTVFYTSPQAQPEPVQEQCPECDGTGTVAGSQAHFPCPICTSPQAAQPLSDEQILSHWAGDTPRPVLGKNKVIAFARAIEAEHNITKGTT